MSLKNRFDVVVLGILISTFYSNATFLRKEYKENERDSSSQRFSKDISKKQAFKPNEKDISATIVNKQAQRTMHLNSIINEVKLLDFKYYEIGKRYNEMKTRQKSRINQTISVNTTEAATVATTPPVSQPIEINLDLRNEIVESHNIFRSFVEPSASNMRFMTWDYELAWISQTFTNSCRYNYLRKRIYKY